MRNVGMPMLPKPSAKETRSPKAVAVEVIP